MKANSLDLRERIVAHVRAGGSKTGAARLFKVCRKSVCNYLAAERTGTLAPKTSWGSWRKLDPGKLRAHVKKHPDATLGELQAVFKVCQFAIWSRPRQTGFTLKKKSPLGARPARWSAGSSPASLKGWTPARSAVWTSAG